MSDTVRDPRSTEPPARPTVAERLVSFTSGGVECRGRLLVPDERTGRPPVILATGFSGTQDTPSIRAAAEAFAAAGYPALTFDYRNFGVSDGEPRQFVDIAGQPDDLRAAIADVLHEEQLGAERVVLWGTSLGGGHVVTAAAGRDDVAAVIAQVPFNGFPKQVEGRRPGTTVRLLAAMTRDAVRGLMGRRPRYSPAVGDEDTVAVMASSRAAEAVAALDSETWRNEVAPRSLFAMAKYRPADSAPEVHAPLLVCAADRDVETPVEFVRELSDRAPAGELIVYPISHFDVYQPEHRQRLLDDQLAFLERVLRG